MELVETIEINGEEREIADAYAREQIATNTQNIATNAEGIAGLNNNLDGLGYGENGAYNLLKPKLLEAVTKKGVTCTPNKDANGNFDGTYTLSGTNSGTWTAFPFANIQNLGGTFKFVVRNDVSNAFVFIWNSTDSKTHDSFSAYKKVTFDANKIYSIQFVINVDGAVIDNDLFKPMLTADLTATYDDFKPYIPSVKMLAEEVSAQNDSLDVLKSDLSECRKKSDITTNETLIGTFNGKNYYRKLFTGISGSGSSITVNVGEKIEIYNYYGRAYVYGQSGASAAKYPIPNKNYYIDSQNISETSFQLTIPTSSDTRKVDLVIEYTKVDE